MYYIPIIAGSTRRDRQSIKVARFVLARLQQRAGVTTELLDLLEYNFPIMEERLHRRDDPPPGLREFGDKIGRADSFIIVSPEYNNGYPGVLKNALDYLLPEYERKPVGIVTVSAGGFGGINCLAQLRLVVIGMIAAQGEADTFEIQLRAALHKGELTPADIQEIIVLMPYYIGYPKAARLRYVMQKIYKELIAAGKMKSFRDLK